MPAPLHNSQTHAALSWAIAARIVLLIAALFATELTGENSALHALFRLPFLYISLASLLIFSLFSFVFVKQFAGKNWFCFLQITVDQLIVTGAVYVTGGTQSPFLFLYLVTVMIAAAISTPTIALGLSASGTSMYALLTFALYYGLIGTSSGEPFSEPSSGLLLQTVGVSSGMILVSVLTGVLVQKVNLGFALVEQSQRVISQVQNRERALLDGLSAAIITVGSEGIVTHLNSTACDLFQTSSHDLMGKNLWKFIAQQDATCKMQSSGPLQEIVFDCSIDIAGDEKKLVVSQRPLVDHQGDVSGAILIFQDITRLRSAEDQLKLQERMARLLSQKNELGGESRAVLEEFVGESTIMNKIFRLIERVAPSEATVLITGESGTGKELVARSIHNGSPRSPQPFLPMNCSAIPENLIESELFGHKKGAFTGADSDHLGIFRAAEGGTVFLDEIGELPLHMQSKLLRVIQQRMVRPVGAERDIPINVRIVSATNKNLKREVEKGTFREDLYYRLNVIGISLPPLRDRRDDIPLLVNAFLKKLLPEDITPLVPPATMCFLMEYNYPGNVRELENILERAVVLGGEAILPEHLPDQVKISADQHGGATGATEIIINDKVEIPVKLDELLSSIERQYLEIALVQTHGAKKRAADLLGMNFRSFRYRLQKFGIGGDDDENDPQASSERRSFQ